MNNKFIVAKIKNVFYTGKNIGSNLILNLNINDLKFSKKIELKIGQKKQNIELFKNFFKDRQVEISCQLIEDDPIFDDLSEVKNFNIFLESESIINKTITFVVTEQGINQQKNIAYITIELELDIIDTIFYVGLLDKGWMVFIDKKTIALEKTIKISLPYGTKIQLIDRDEKYLYFIAKEGLNATGVELGISIKNVKYLLKDIKYKPSVQLIYSISQKSLQINESKYQATQYEYNILKKGTYKLFLADSPHKDGSHYESITKYAKTWFRLNDKDKYLHPGRASAGCITIIELEQWNKIYHQLILARTGDGETIGTVEVID